MVAGEAAERREGSEGSEGSEGAEGREAESVTTCSGSSSGRRRATSPTALSHSDRAASAAPALYSRTSTSPSRFVTCGNTPPSAASAKHCAAHHQLTA